MTDEKPKPAAEPEEDEATEADAKVARSQPAVFVNSFLISVMEEENLFRITFGEGVTDKRDRIRFALVMPTGDVRELVRILNSLLPKLGADEADAEKAGDKTDSTRK